MLRDRFGKATSNRMQSYSSSLQVDMQMLEEDVRGSMAHVRMLGEVGLLTDAEVSALSGGLALVWQEIRDGEFVPGDELEDVHMAVEARLIEHLGDLGGKLHTARSRNDQVATDVRLWLRARLRELDTALAELIGTLLDRVESDGRALIPGYTHVQRGQPILLGHHLLAHAWPLQRDRGRIADALGRLDLCPLGSCAMAGTSLPIDRHRTAELLEFAGPAENAMDAVSARDHEQETAATCAIVMTHLSRMAEELVWWSSTEFRLVRLSSDHATGSSIMPQKHNPDAAELMRGKTSLVHGHLVTLMTLAKGLPMSYNRDFQEGRAPLFAAVTTTLDSVSLMAEVWSGLTIHASRYEASLAGDFCLSTELADFLVRSGLDFRRAHSVAARIVRWCEEHDTDLAGLPQQVAAGFHPALDTDLGDLLDARAAAERRSSYGGSSWSEIERQVALLRDGSGEDATD